MKRLMRTGLMSAGFLLMACGSYRQEVQRICECPQRAGKTADFFEVIEGCGDVWGAIKSAKGKELQRSIAGVGDSEKGRLLQAAATEQGLASCSMADIYAKQGAQRPPAFAPQ